MLLCKSNAYYIFWMCVCILCYPASKARAPYNSVICGLSGCNINFPHYLINSTIFGKKFSEHEMCVLVLSTILSENFLSLRITERNVIINVHRCSCTVKVKCTLVQALRLCTGRTVHRGSRGIALLYRHWGSVQAVRPIGGVEV
jgi:hypothetical protein